MVKVKVNLSLFSGRSWEERLDERRGEGGGGGGNLLDRVACQSLGCRLNKVIAYMKIHEKKCNLVLILL